MPIDIRPLTPAQEQDWDSFVHSHAQGTPFHLTTWKRCIEETFGYRSIYLAAWEQGQIRGVLPLFLLSNILMGKVLISSPFAVYGGVLADSEECKLLFGEHLRKLGKDLNVEHVELRNAHPNQCLGFSRISRYVTFQQPIGPDEDTLLSGIPRKTRYIVRKSLREDLSTRVQRSCSTSFRELFAKNLRKLGTPCFPYRYFDRLFAAFKDMVDIREVVHRKQVVAAVLTLYFKDLVLPYYGASDGQFNALAPSSFMYYDLMRWAGKNGYRTFDFGRSKKEGSGSYDFKAHWGMEERALPYEVLLVNRKTLPNYTPANPRYQLPIKLWRHLPLPLTKAIGPALVRLVP